MPQSSRYPLGKCVYGKPYRGFESHSLRHIPIESLHNSERNFLKVNRCRRCVVDSIKTEEKMHLRKRNNKWQCLINHKGCRIAKTFIRKQDAQRWALKITTQLENNSFQDTSCLTTMTCGSDPNVDCLLSLIAFITIFLSESDNPFPCGARVED